MDKKDFELCGKIADRAVMLLGWNKSTVFMDITTCQEHNPLDLQRLLEADNANFLHDICGINRYLNHQTYDFDDFWSPRYLKR